jgi:poly-gamma-glutamate capsule biosynthesis protein CapA/YwtB (metallophosphatase superfamily)
MRVRATPHLRLVAAAVCACPLGASSQSPYRSSKADISFALVGDAIVSRPLSVNTEREHIEMVQAIRGADVAFANLEIVFQAVEDLTPMVSDRESYMFAEPGLAGDLADIGFDMVSRANNHSLDYGWEGMRATSRALTAAGIAFAGVGENLALAERPAFVDVASGRVALISTATTYEDFQAARPQRRDIRATPGLNPLRHRRVFVLDAQRMDALRGIARALGEPVGDGSALTFLGQAFTMGQAPGVRTRADETDLARILASIRAAKQEADWVVVATHSHESGSAREVPAGFIVEYAHAAIDAGADVFVGTGPHVLRGIEIYKGRPVFYSLGNFAFENETVAFRPSAEWQRVDLPPDAHTADYYDERQRTSNGYFTQDPVYWESVVALPMFRDGLLAEIRLMPLTLGFGTPRSQRGRPVRADPGLSAEIVERLADLSRPFGTRIRLENGMGVVEIVQP